MTDPKRRRLLDDLAEGPSAASELFADDDDQGSAAPPPPSSSRSFADFLRTTPPRPLTSTEKTLLIAAGTAVALLFAISLYKVAG